MTKFKIAHGCCFVDTKSTKTDPSTTTCQVYENTQFQQGTKSEPECGAGKSSPEFHRKQVSWKDLTDDNHDVIISENELRAIRKSGVTQSEPDQNTSFITLYGNEHQLDADTWRKQKISDGSIYRPTTMSIVESNEISTTDKILDCMSTCLWKCSTWCQKID